MKKDNEYDAIVIGSGTGGAALARELARQKKKVLILERGGDTVLKDSLMSFAAISDEVAVGKKLTTVRAITHGGSSALYFGVVNYPPLDAFAALGMDLSAELEEVRRELPIAPLPDAMVGAQSIRLRDSARALGHAWNKHDMLIDQSKCGLGYTHGALWRARSYLEEAVRQGATLISRADVHKVIVDKGQAIGVEYRIKKNRFKSEMRQVYGAKIILAAGELASPKLLRDSGVQGIGTRGFFCNPGYALYGRVPGLQGRDNFVGSMGCEAGEGIELGDANVSHYLHRLMMLSKFKLGYMRAYPETVGIGVKVKDSVGGRLGEDGRFHKDFTEDDYARLRRGEEEAGRILKNAGARDIFNFGISCAGRVGGLVAIGEHLDANLETAVRNLHVCDGSVIPEQMRGTPTLTLLSMSKYLANHLSSAC